MARIYVDPLSWDEAERLKTITFNHFKQTGDYAPYMLFLNGFHSAFRWKDLHDFRWSTYQDVVHDDGTKGGMIRFKKESKTGKYRELPMSKTYFNAVKYMMAMLKRPENEYVHRSTYYAGKDCPRIHYRTAKRWIKTWCEKAGIEKTVAIHTLRKTWALRAYELLGRNEHALLEISTALNHRHTQDTRTYIGLSPNSEAINKIYMII